MIEKKPAILSTARSLGTTASTPASLIGRQEANELASPEKNPAVVWQPATSGGAAVIAEMPAILSTTGSLHGPATTSGRSTASAPAPLLKKLKTAAVTGTGLDPAPEADRGSASVQQPKLVHRKSETAEVTAASSGPARATSRQRPPPQRDKCSYSCTPQLITESQLCHRQSRRRWRHAAPETEKVKAVPITTARCQVSSASRKVEPPDERDKLSWSGGSSCRWIPNAATTSGRSTVCWRPGQRRLRDRVHRSSLETWWKKVITYCYSTKAGGELRPVLRRPREHEAGGRHAGAQDGSLEQPRQRALPPGRQAA